MKGITPVVAIILLLMITIVIIGFATGFFQQIITTTGEGATGQAQETTEAYQKVAQLSSAGEDATGAVITVMSVGAIDIPTSEIGVFINGLPQNCAWEDVAGTPITDVTNIGVCVVAGGTCTAGDPVKVSSPGMEDTGVCE